MRPQKFSDQEILEQTRACLLAHGTNVSTQIIAQSLGMSQANLFKRFGTKANLIKRALLYSIEIHPIFERLMQKPNTADISKAIKSLCMDLIDFFDTQLPNILMLKSAGFDLPNMMKGDTVSPPIRMRRLLTSWFNHLKTEQGMREISAEGLTMLILGSVQHRAFRKHILDDVVFDSDAEFVQSIFEIFWHGISCGEKNEC